jgi:hypothetical protein
LPLALLSMNRTISFGNTRCVQRSRWQWGHRGSVIMWQHRT